MGIIENIKEVADLVKKAGNIDLYRKITELEGEIIELTHQKRSLEEQVEELNRLLNVKQQMVFNKRFYYQGDNAHPYCHNCWEVDEKAVHLDRPQDMMAGPRYDCPNCKNHFIHPRRSVDIPQFASGSDQANSLIFIQICPN